MKRKKGNLKDLNRFLRLVVGDYFWEVGNTVSLILLRREKKFRNLIAVWGTWNNSLPFLITTLMIHLHSSCRNSYSTYVNPRKCIKVIYWFIGICSTILRDFRRRIRNHGLLIFNSWHKTWANFKDRLTKKDSKFFRTLSLCKREIYTIRTVLKLFIYVL